MEPNNPTPKKTTPIIPIEYKRLPDDQFFEGYANNVFIEPTAWDLKLIFGNIDLGKGPGTVVQHSAITLTWSQIKASMYFLEFHLLLHEMTHGKVTVPKGVITPPVPPTEEQEKGESRAREVFEAVHELFKRFSEANPESF